MARMSQTGLQKVAGWNSMGSAACHEQLVTNPPTTRFVDFSGGRSNGTNRGRHEKKWRGKETQNHESQTKNCYTHKNNDRVVLPRRVVFL